MSEYWVSHKKYFCKYCNIYIADDKPSRTQHENGLKHKGNVERFVRGLYKAGEKRKQDLEEEKREMVRIERAAAASFAQDVGSGLVKPGSSGAPIAKQPQAGPSKPARPSDPYANYTTAASLGITDPDEERRKAEEERRRNEGVVGAWEVVAIEEPVHAEETGDGEERAEGVEDGAVGAPAAATQQTLKREAEAPPDDEDARQFRLRRKKLNTGLGEIYDPGLIPIKLKAKKEEPTEPPLPKEESPAPIRLAPAISNPNATEMPKWSARGWAKPGEAKQPGPSSTDQVGADTQAVKGEVPLAVPEAPVPTSGQDAPSEEQAPEVKAEAPPEVKQEPETVTSMAPPSLFKKRKAPTASAGGRGRRL